jgi:large subunit ribosomal protein L22
MIMTKVTAQLNNVRISPRKVRLVADRVRGIGVNEAIGLLKYDLRKTAQPMEKLLKSAVANAQNNFKIKSDDLIVSDVIVGEGPTLKRWMPRAYGRASKILKRTSRVSVVLCEKDDKMKKVEQKEEKTTNEVKKKEATTSTSSVKVAEKKKVADKKSK